MSAFLESAGWAGAIRTPVAADASARQFKRLTCDGETAILMHDPDGDVARFALVARHLTGLGFSAPKILALDAAQGLLLMEDLGRAMLSELCTTRHEAEAAHYAAVAEMLAALHRHAPPSDLDAATPAHLAQATDLTFELYIPAATGAAPDPAAAGTACAALEQALAKHAPETSVMMLRDLHAENILWLPEREGTAQVGLIDIQDAMQGHPAYDLASLVEDARRDVPEAVRAATIRSYLDASGTPERDIEAAMAVQGAQRHLRLLGVFTRLAAAGKPHYLDLMPRVWGHLARSLQHPALGQLARALDGVLPEPTPAVRARIGTS